MNGFLGSAARGITSVATNITLAGIAVGIASGGVALTAHYLADHIEKTPAMVKLMCLVQDSNDCPDRKAELAALETELRRLIDEREELDDQLAGLRRLESSVDHVTLFETIDDPNSSLTVTVGTVYRKFVDAEPEPSSYFCYIDLRQGSAGESRNLHFKHSNSWADISADRLTEAGVSDTTYKFAKSVCEPTLIGRE